ncbi:MAG: hypothetical protein ACK40G_12910 [Cytophagaceae bacterium]
MKNLYVLICFLIFIFLVSCQNIKRAPKNELLDGIYHSSIKKQGRHRVYVEVHGDTIEAFNASKKGGEYVVLRNQPIKSFPASTDDKSATSEYMLYKPSFDIGIVSVPVKFRPSVSGFPAQLNSEVNAAIYLGSRFDLFKIHYHQTPIRIAERDINHLGFSVGIFGGIGSTFMNPWVTNYSIDSEYDGIVIIKGISGVIAFNNFSAGVAVGTDFLTDKNRQHWIYQEKLWLGLLLGININ